MDGVVVSIGIDLIEIPRIRETLSRHGERFLSRVYTGRERQRVALLADPAPYLAGRFAAKEAVLKALGTGLSQGIRWQDVEIRRAPSGKPLAFLGGRAAEAAARAGIGGILVSISHGRDLAVAQAVGLAG